MTMQYDVKAAHTNTSAALVAGRTRLKQVVFTSDGTAGTLVLYDNATTGSGNVLWQYDVPALATPYVVTFPGEGILAYNGIYASLTHVSAVTICYG
jgi:hypothetical protein